MNEGGGVEKHLSGKSGSAEKSVDKRSITEKIEDDWSYRQAEYQRDSRPINPAVEGETSLDKKQRELLNKRAKIHNEELQQRLHKEHTKFKNDTHGLSEEIKKGKRTRRQDRIDSVKKAHKVTKSPEGMPGVSGPKTIKNKDAWADYDLESERYDLIAGDQKAIKDIKRRAFWADQERKHPGISKNRDFETGTSTVRNDKDYIDTRSNVEKADTTRLSPRARAELLAINNSDSIKPPTVPDNPRPVGKRSQGMKVHPVDDVRLRNSKPNVDQWAARDKADAYNKAHKDDKDFKKKWVEKPAYDRPGPYKPKKKTKTPKAERLSTRTVTKAQKAGKALSAGVGEYVPKPVKNAWTTTKDIARPFKGPAKNLLDFGGRAALGVSNAIDSVNALTAPRDPNLNLSGAPITFDNAGIGIKGFGFGKVDDSWVPSLNAVDLTPAGRQGVQNMNQRFWHSLLGDDENPWVDTENFYHAVSQMDEASIAGFMAAPKKDQRQYIKDLQDGKEKVAGRNLDILVKKYAPIKKAVPVSVSTPVPPATPEQTKTIMDNVNERVYKQAPQPMNWSSQAEEPVIESGMPTPPQVQNAQGAPAQLSSNQELFNQSVAPGPMFPQDLKHLYPHEYQTLQGMPSVDVDSIPVRPAIYNDPVGGAENPDLYKEYLKAVDARRGRSRMANATSTTKLPNSVQEPDTPENLAKLEQQRAAGSLEEAVKIGLERNQKTAPTTDIQGQTVHDTLKAVGMTDDQIAAIDDDVTSAETPVPAEPAEIYQASQEAFNNMTHEEQQAEIARRRGMTTAPARRTQIGEVLTAPAETQSEPVPESAQIQGLPSIVTPEQVATFNELNAAGKGNRTEEKNAFWAGLTEPQKAVLTGKTAPVVEAPVNADPIPASAPALTVDPNITPDDSMPLSAKEEYLQRVQQGAPVQQIQYDAGAAQTAANQAYAEGMASLNGIPASVASVPVVPPPDAPAETSTKYTPGSKQDDPAITQAARQVEMIQAAENQRLAQVAIADRYHKARLNPFGAGSGYADLQRRRQF